MGHAPEESCARAKRIRARLKNDFVHYAKKCLKIRAKEGGIHPFVLNDAQMFIHDAIERQRAETGRVRALILKGRQQGCSTYVQGRFYWRVTHNRGARAFILTHMDEASRNLYQIVRRFHDHCPLPVKPHTSLSNVREMVFDRLDSGYLVGTAKSQGIGRSSTLQFFHGSEVAYWDNAQAHVSGVLQAVPDAGGTEVILESTSAGATGLFYEMCRAAMAGQSEYIFIFVPWFWQREYRKNPPEDFAPTPAERRLMTEDGLDPAQVYWRRCKIYELGGVWHFRREYPMTAQDAFHADHPDALWTRRGIEKNRVDPAKTCAMKRVVVAVDPAVTAHARSDETGIVVAGLGVDGDAYVLADLSGKYTPAEWAAVVVDAYYKYEADRVVAEVNQGGALVEYTLRVTDGNVPYRAVRASRGKVARAEPVAALDEQGRVHHAGVFETLEDQMCGFGAQQGKSPDRVDARVWAVTELMLGRTPPCGPKIWR